MIYRFFWALKISLSGILFMGILINSASAESPLVLQVHRGVALQADIAIAPFANESGLFPYLLSDIVRNDLRLSGQFRVLDETRMLSLPERAEEIDYREWRQNDTEYLLIGRVISQAGQDFILNFSLFDVLTERLLMNQRYAFDKGAYRTIAHLAADQVYEQITGVQGSFSTRLAFVRSERRGGDDAYQLMIADADGFNPRTILRSSEPIVSLAWSMNGSKLAYVSFERGRPNIFIQDINSGSRQLIADFPGINSAPTWSPDEKQMAIVLSANDNVDIYLIDIATQHARRLTVHPGIDTEPAWSSSGKTLAFTSDRDGSVQIYEYRFADNTIRRLTDSGSYNARPRYALEDRALVMISRTDSGYQTTYMDLLRNRYYAVSQAQLDDSPTISPDGSRVAYMTKSGDRYRIAIASIDFGQSQILPLGEGSFQHPAWSPYLFP